MKIISDIRIYKSTAAGEHIGFADKATNLAVRRVVMKLREQGFSLGPFDHLYLNFTVCRPAGTVELIDAADRYHPWYRYCDVGISQSEYDGLGTGDCLDFIYEKIEAALSALFASDASARDMIAKSVAAAKKGPEMLMRFKEKRSAKGTAVIYLRLLENGKYRPLLCVSSLDGEEILRADLPETIDLGIIGEIQLNRKKVTVKPRNNAFTKELKPITFEIDL